jgi:phage tail sheath protein FI
MPTYRTPGVYREDVALVPAARVRTGVPAFLGSTSTQAAAPVPVNTPRRLTSWSDFGQQFGVAGPDAYLAHAVRGFFQNDGAECYAVRLDPAVDATTALRQGLNAVRTLDDMDLVCAPDIVRVAPDAASAQRLQSEVLDHCDGQGDRFAILDSPRGAGVDDVLAHRRALRGASGALYYPWVRPEGGLPAPLRVVPPCGHVAGVYARTDRRAGVHRAPANAVLAGVADLERQLSSLEQERLNPEGVNCLRAFPGRGVRIWGARTVSPDPAWTYVGVRRLFQTAGRWIVREMADQTFEPNDARLWARIQRELTAYCDDLFRRGALRGDRAEEAFYVKCDAETNLQPVREAGMVVAEIGLAPVVPGEFVVARIVRDAAGVSLTGSPQAQ